MNHKLSFVCVASTWEWLSELSNHTKQWLQCTIGLARRLFPVYFSLCTTPGDVLDPSLLAEDAEGKVLFMEPRDDPIPLCDDDPEITFKRRIWPTWKCRTCTGRLPLALGEIGTTPPLHLLAGEMDSEEDDSPNNGIAPRHKKKKMVGL